MLFTRPTESKDRLEALLRKGEQARPAQEVHEALARVGRNGRMGLMGALLQVIAINTGVPRVEDYRIWQKETMQGLKNALFPRVMETEDPVKFLQRVVETETLFLQHAPAIKPDQMAETTVSSTYGKKAAGAGAV